MVLRHLYAILLFVFLNMLVTFRICGEIYVNVANFLFLLSCGAGCSVLCSIGVLVYVLLRVGNSSVGRYVELFTTLFLL